MSSETIIKVDSLNVSYGTDNILHDINFSIQEGEFVSLIGKSGCGKSTLLKALASFIESNGQKTVPNDIGMVFQNYAVYPWLTVEDNISFGLEHLEAKQRKERAEHYLSVIDLEGNNDKYPTELSGGQVQRVALARALAPSPKVIFMDEPFGALDMFTRDKMQDWLNDIWEKEHKTVLFVTHNIEEAMFLSDRILIMGQGAINKEIDMPFERPRKPSIKYSADFINIKQSIVEVLETS